MAFLLLWLIAWLYEGQPSVHEWWLATLVGAFCFWFGGEFVE